MNIVPATLEDCHGISEIFTLVDTEEYKSSDKQKIKASIKQGTIFVIKENNIVVAGVDINRDCGTLEIKTLCSKIKSGGKEFIQFCENLCREENIPKLWCWSQAEFNAVGFYEKMGFEERLLMKKQGFGKDCWILGKEIS